MSNEKWYLLAHGREFTDTTKALNRAIEKPFVKIGVSARVFDRMREDTKCACGCDFGKLKLILREPVAYPKKVETFVHIELSDFNFLHAPPANIDSSTKRATNHDAAKKRTTKKMIRHKEWFDVSPTIASQSVMRWVTFFNAAYTPEGQPRNSWGTHLRKLYGPSVAEEEGFSEGDDALSHKSRNDRLQKWLDKGLDQGL